MAGRTSDFHYHFSCHCHAFTLVRLRCHAARRDIIIMLRDAISLLSFHASPLNSHAFVAYYLRCRHTPYTYLLLKDEILIFFHFFIFSITISTAIFAAVAAIIKDMRCLRCCRDDVFFAPMDTEYGYADGPMMMAAYDIKMIAYAASLSAYGCAISASADIMRARRASIIILLLRPISPFFLQSIILSSSFSRLFSLFHFAHAFLLVRYHAR